jgi:hypothetical protein
VTIVGPSGPFTVEPDEIFSLDSTVMSVNIPSRPVDRSISRLRPRRY